MIISFAWTAEALLAGHKTMTRRLWAPAHVEMWRRAYDQGRTVHKAYDKLPHSGGQQIGEITLTCRPCLQRLGDMPEGDLEREGGLWPDLEGFAEQFGGNLDLQVCVVEFAFRPTAYGALFYTTA